MSRAGAEAEEIGADVGVDADAAVDVHVLVCDGVGVSLDIDAKR